MGTNKYEDFFERISKFKEKQNKQKQRGLNNFNLLTTVRKYHDEVYLHSAMIGALLNPNGLHYQDTLFLEKFIEVLDLGEFKLHLSSDTKVYVEYEGIDLYITDGARHIIIENKVWAKDQPYQIIRYINVIKEQYGLKTDDNKIPLIKDIYVIYLTPQDKEVPNGHTVNNKHISYSKGKEEKLKEQKIDNYQVKYKKITYKEEILKWLDLSKKEVENITNLNEAIKQYRDVVQMIDNNYKGRVMELSKELSKKENFEIAFEVNEIFQETCIELESDFWNQLIKKIGSIEEYKGITIDEYGKEEKNEDTKDIVLKTRNSKKGEIAIYFDITDNINLCVSTDNKEGCISATVFKKDWNDITNDDEKIKEAISNISGYDFNLGDLDCNWYADTTICKINLRGKELIQASKKVDEIAEKITTLVEELRKIK